MGIGKGEIAVSTAIGGGLAALLAVALLKRGIGKLQQGHQNRYIANPLEDYSQEAFAAQEAQLAQWSELVRTKRQEILQAIADNVPPTKNFLHHSIYYGSAGLSYLYWRLWRAEKENTELRNQYFERAVQYAQNAGQFYDSLSEDHPTSSACGFLFGESGYCALRSLLAHIQRDEDQSEDFLQKMLAQLPKVTPTDAGNSNLMYGSSGYLSCCLFLRQQIPSFPLGVIPILFGYILRRGEEEWRQMQASKQLIDREARKRLGFIHPCSKNALDLIYWANRQKYGFVISTLLRPVVSLFLRTSVFSDPSELNGMLHGNAGSIYQLLACPELVHSSMEATILLRNSLEHLLQTRTPDGEYPSGMLSVKYDTYTEWCRGTTGMGFLFARAYEVFQDQRYLDAAKEASDVVWKQGIAKKGFSLCHGVAGNGYLFLALYRITNDSKYLYRARMFATFICQEMNLPTSQTKHVLYSLYEGWSGVVLFLDDVLHPSDSRFPVLEDNF